tara:strand:- start:396 stop:1028 length:633 start_codon:yes stop_codon:yes gene_type:complete
MPDNFIEIMKPFGPSVARTKIPDEMIKKINDYVDKIIEDKKKSEALDHGKSLAGNVTQEFELEKEFIKEIKWGEFLGNSVRSWIAETRKKKITKFNLISSWVVRQFENEYNPVHWHGGHVSGVGYLKVPNILAAPKTKKDENNGMIELLHGSKMFLSDSHLKIKPTVGSFYFFPNYLMHTVYPFKNTKEERRSISFNATIDNDIYDVYTL